MAYWLRAVLLMGSAGPCFGGLIWEGAAAFHVDSLALLEDDQGRLQSDMRRIAQQVGSSLRKLSSFAHPGRGSDLYKYLQLDETMKHELAYFDARERALRTAEHYAPRVHSFFRTQFENVYNEASRTLRSAANDHISSIVDRPALSFVIKTKYEALDQGVRDMLVQAQQALDGVVLDQGHMLQSVHKKAVGSLSEGLRNPHTVDDYQVACSVSRQFAEWAAATSTDALLAKIPQWVAREEAVKIPIPKEALEL